MVLILQLILFLFIVLIRGRYLFGRHLRRSKTNPKMLDYRVRQKNGNSSRQIGIEYTDGVSLIVCHEKWHHRWLKRIGIASEVHIQKDDFDTRYFITTDFPNQLEHAVAAGHLPKLLEALFRLPVASLHANSRRMWCVITAPDTNHPAKFFAPHLKIMESIAQALRNSASRESQSSAGIRRKGIIAFLFICAHVGLLSLGVAGFIHWMADGNDLIDRGIFSLQSLILVAAWLVAWCALAVRLLQKTSWICWVFFDFLLCGVAGMVLCGPYFIREININLPQSAPTIQHQRVLSKECTLNCRRSCGKRCTRRSTYYFKGEAECNPATRAVNRQLKIEADRNCASEASYSYELSLSHWKKPEPYEYGPKADFFDSVYEQSVLTVPTHPGALGIEWVDTDSIELHQR